ncbi:hypothetical protein CHS0354_011777 [Potamilus streckersoni]|uniref:Uncharacterized protein n=1 Tax=Potamilus streckersoni TaxID=2493646 RepID=A0AAE0TH87_9BIVA|nr:hypothetical protein CHS0354_011777 [Potamilus streckersoni]
MRTFHTILQLSCKVPQIRGTTSRTIQDTNLQMCQLKRTPLPIFDRIPIHYKRKNIIQLMEKKHLNYNQTQHDHDSMTTLTLQRNTFAIPTTSSTQRGKRCIGRKPQRQHPPTEKTTY